MKRLIATLAVAAGLAAPALAEDVVKFGSLRVPVQVYAGMGKGFFEAEGITVEPTFFKSGSEIAPAVATGQVDAAITTSGAALFNALARGAEFTIVAEALNIEPGAPGGDPTAIMVRSDAGIESGADLAGKKIAVTAPGQILDMIVNEYIAQSGVNPEDVTKVGMAPPDMVPALTNGSVDAAIMIDPFQSIALGGGTVTRLVRASEVMPGTSQAFMVYSNGMMAREDVAVRFLRAYKATNDWIREALATPEGRTELAGYYQQYVPAKDASVYEKIAMGTASESLAVNVDGDYGLRWQMQTLIDAGLVPQAPDLDAHLNTALLDQASN
ncbi:ABC transporter substrate-binding protein [uncultured Maritimibacter sp.]|uniref:ABC transporter substrate-binding protein n=1 Tax=uncultured Maritimibacter sp. TaxID=991866 RepID=UPI0025967C87|nr:ABC transporter substrate-binding protein [uncultured Maritimibacter sp.]